MESVWRRTSAIAYLRIFLVQDHNNRGPGRPPVYEILTKFCSHDYHFIFLDFIYYVGNGFTYKQQKNFF